MTDDYVQKQWHDYRHHHAGGTRAMSDYQEMYELERRRADICEGQILELRRQVFALNEEIDRSRSERQYWHDSAQKMTDKWFATKRKVAKLQKALKQAAILLEEPAP